MCHYMIFHSTDLAQVIQLQIIFNIVKFITCNVHWEYNPPPPPKKERNEIGKGEWLLFTVQRAFDLVMSNMWYDINMGLSETVFEIFKCTSITSLSELTTSYQVQYCTFIHNFYSMPFYIFTTFSLCTF